jgi:hypothetical protein
VNLTRRTFLKGVAVLAAGTVVDLPTRWVIAPAASAKRAVRVSYRARVPNSQPMTFWVLVNGVRAISADVPAGAQRVTVEADYGLRPGDEVSIGFDLSDAEYAEDVTLSLALRDDRRTTGVFAIPGKLQAKEYEGRWMVP